jgi:hypothetical protein
MHEFLLSWQADGSGNCAWVAMASLHVAVLSYMQVCM